MYGERRKRNINLLRDEQTIQKKRLLTDEDDWLEEESDLEEDYEEIEVYEEMDDNEEEPEQDELSATVFLIDGKPFALKQQEKKPTFQESHTRITTYLQNNLYSIVKILQKQNQIESITSFINESVKHYLLERYQEKHT
ncbi:hypothetical protein ACFSO7_06885 [Bacillus sp. CGMCC 1.16607]|uniref:hypothetical protein n=1 Tax=Bacillus sp. CGMCC 1.16607 TaxID=3351842 RepID=UPI00363A225C